MRPAALFVPGVLFGVGLAVSGMTDPAKVLGFLDVAGAWDPSLAFVMIGAIGTFAPLNMLIHRRAHALDGTELPGARSHGGVNARLLAGAAVFGVGWGLAGICPGPAGVDLATLRPGIVAFVAAMLVGMVVAQRGLGADPPDRGA